MSDAKATPVSVWWSTAIAPAHPTIDPPIRPPSRPTSSSLVQKEFLPAPQASVGSTYDTVESNPQRLGANSEVAVDALVPEYVGWRERNGMYGSSCNGLVPTLGRNSELVHFSCTYYPDLGETLTYPNGQKYIGPPLKSHGFLPECHANGLQLGNISDKVLHDIRMISSEKWDPQGIAHLKPEHWACSLMSPFNPTGNW
jgi:hypothetical protein